MDRLIKSKWKLKKNGRERNQLRKYQTDRNEAVGSMKI